MAQVTFTNTKCNEAVVGTGNQTFQSHIAAANTVGRDELNNKVADKLKMSPALASQVNAATTEVIKEELGDGNRIAWEGLFRCEIVGNGSFATVDEPWDSTKHSLALAIIPYDDVKKSLEGIVPVNEVSPTNVVVSGVQDATTMEQDTYTKGHSLLIQGKNLTIDTTKQLEGVFFRKADGSSIRATVTASTAATIDCTCNETALVAGEYTLVVKSRNGKGDDYMPVEVTRPITVKVAA